MPPTQLLASLESLRRRARTLNVAHGVAVVLLIACGLLFGAGLVDYLLRLPGLPRLLLLMAGFGGMAWLVYQHVYRPVVARLSLGDVAGRVEETFPQFEDRLRSSVQFLGEGGDGDPLRRRAVEQAGDIARGVDFDDALVTRPAYLAAAAATAAVAILVILAFLLGPLAGVVIGRLFDPLNPAHQWPKTYQIEPISLAKRVPAGASVPVTMTLAKGSPESVEPTVFYQLDDGPARQLLMTRQADGSFTAAFDSRLAAGATSGALKVWVEAGDDVTMPQAVTVVPRLVVENVTAEVTPPPYVPGGRTTSQPLAEGPVVTAEGSTVTLRAEFNKPLAKYSPIALEAVGDAPAPDLDWNVTGQTATATFVADRTLRFTLTATDRDGFTGESPQAVEVIVRPDSLPGVTVENPRRSESRTAASVVPLVVAVDDDYGFRDVSLVARRLAAPDKPESAFEVVTPLYSEAGPADGVGVEPIGEAGDRVRLRLSRDWDLSQMLDPQGQTLQPGDVVEYLVRVTDNYERDGQYHEPVDSGKLRITIISQEELSQQVIKDLRDVKDQIAATKTGQDRNQRETVELGETARDKGELDAADRAAAERLSRQQSATAAATKRLGDKVGEIGERLEENNATAEDLKQLTEDVQQQLDRTAEGEMKAAAAELEQAKAEQASGEQAKKALDKSGQKQGEASDKLRRAMEQMEQIGSLRSTLDEVASLLSEQKKLGEMAREMDRKNLGKTPEQMSDADREALEDAAKKQEELAEKTDAALSKMEKSAAEMQQADPAASESMKKAAEAGKQQQTSQQQRQAAASQKQNQQQQSQRARQQAEIGLEMVLSELKEGERRKLLELQKKLAAIQEQLDRLVKRQAGHNLDNRDLSGADVKADQFADLREAAGVGGDGPAELVKATLPRLSDGQELTERNTRDLSKTAEDLPSDSTAADLLTRAAARMERAAVFLRQKELDQSYDPPQVEALDALQGAIADVERQQREVDKQIADEQRETIRQKLVDVRAAQADAVNGPTSQVQAKREAGELRPRSLEQQRLNALPGVQGGLAGRVGELVEPLTQVGGVAFVYAAKEIESAMKTVEDRLKDGDTAEATQIEQRRVVSGLDAMIESLKVEPRQDRFAKNGGGDGQCQGGQPALPPEAELQLVKKLQEAVNTATEELDKLKQKQQDAQPPVGDRLAGVGGRQGDIRGVLDQMLQKYSQGRIKLGPEPDPETRLPEEADAGALDERELGDDLLGQNAGNAGEEGDQMRVGDRMARSRQRLSLSRDPGAVTQAIQQRIVLDLDKLIEEARSQQAQQQSNPQQQQQQQAQRPKPQPNPGQQQAQNQGQKPGQPKPDGQQSAQQSTASAPGGEANATGELKESLAEWGQLTPRQRAAIIESGGEEVLDPYRRYIEEYFKRLNQERTGEQP